MNLPEWFDASRLKLSSETCDGMLSLDDKNYIIFNRGKLIKHGSGLKGRHLPAICDNFIDELCWAIFEGRNPYEVYRNYVDLTGLPLSDFFFTVTLGKRNYHSTSMYAKIADKADVNASLRLVKTKEGYALTGEPDYDYYKRRLAEVAARLIPSVKAKVVRKYLMTPTKMTDYVEEKTCT